MTARLHRGGIGRGPRRLLQLVGLLTHGGEDVLEDARLALCSRDVRAAFGGDLGRDPDGGLLDLVHRLGRCLGRRAERHVHVRDGHVALDVGLEDEAHPAALQQAGRDHERGEAGGGRQIAPLERAIEEGPVAMLEEVFEAFGDGGLEPAPALGDRVRGDVVLVLLRALAVSEMCGQHEERLDQRKGETRAHDQRNDARDPAHGPGDEEHRRKRSDGREHTEDDRRRDAVHPAHGCVQARAALCLLGVRVLTDDDRVVDHDAEHDDEGHQRDQVDRDVEARHDGERAEERERHAEAHPEREPQAQEEGEHEQHEQEAALGVARERLDAAAQEDRVVLGEGQ